MPRETALITGASSGIGLELARLFAADESNLVLVARREQALREVAAELQSRHKIDVHVLPFDLSLATAPDEIFKRTTSGGIDVDVVVNNAGFGDVGGVVELTLKQQLAAIQVNVTALTALTRLYLPRMLEHHQGGVLNVGSTAGFQPGPRMAVYYATKAYVLSFTEALAEELVNTGVSATCLAPGVTRTPFLPRSGLQRSRLSRFGSLDVQYVARAGYRGFRAGRTLVVPGIANRMLIFVERFTPRSAVRKIAHWLQQER